MKSIAVAVMITLSGVACSDPSLRAALEATNQKVDSLESQVRVLRLRQIVSAPTTTAALDPVSEGFAILESTYGPLAFKVAAVRPVADGSQVVLDVGNLSSADIGAGYFIVRYGSRQAEAQTSEEWRQGLRETEARFTSSLLSGAWNSITVTLSDIRPENLGYVGVEVGELPSISLVGG